jgi:NADPH:quinone reductase-like Zn-dependent oxidoreductase
MVLRNVGMPTATVRLEERAKPTLERGEVLLRVHASPVNPSDRLFVQGLYGIAPTEGRVAGFEGTGTVVEANAGIYGRYLLGKRVSAAVQGEDGFWAEYVKVPAARCLPLGAVVPVEAAACALVNPLTAWALFDPVRTGAEPALVQTAGASQVGRMIVRLGKRYRKPVVSVVHRSGLVDTLRAEGAGDVLDSSAPDFETRLREQCARWKIRYAVDAVGGPIVATIGRALEPGGTVHVYGALSLKNAEADPLALIFRDATVKGFWLNRWIEAQGALGMLRMQRRLETLLPNELRTEVAHRLGFEAFAERYEALAANTSVGKTLLVP